MSHGVETAHRGELYWEVHGESDVVDDSRWHDLGIGHGDLLAILEFAEDGSHL